MPYEPDPTEIGVGQSLNTNSERKLRAGTPFEQFRGRRNFSIQVRNTDSRFHEKPAEQPGKETELETDTGDGFFVKDVTGPREVGGQKVYGTSGHPLQVWFKEPQTSLNGQYRWSWNLTEFYSHINFVSAALSCTTPTTRTSPVNCDLSQPFTASFNMATSIGNQIGPANVYCPDFYSLVYPSLSWTTTSNYFPHPTQPKIIEGTSTSVTTYTWRFGGGVVNENVFTQDAGARDLYCESGQQIYASLSLEVRFQFKFGTFVL